MRTIRFLLWLTACVLFAVAFCLAFQGKGRPLALIAAGLLAASANFLITASQALD